MKRKAVFVGFASVLIAVALFGLLRPKPKPTAFESGYGMDFLAEFTDLSGATPVTIRYFSSKTRFEDSRESLNALLADGMPGTSGYNARAGRRGRFWDAPEGLVILDLNAEFAPTLNWPEGTRSFLRTESVHRPTFFEKAAQAVGIRL